MDKGEFKIKRIRFIKEQIITIRQEADARQGNPPVSWHDPKKQWNIEEFDMKKVLVATIAIIVAACAPVPIYEVDRHPIPPTAQNLPEKKIEKAIVEAAVLRGWQVESIEPGRLLGTYKKKLHKAVIEIHYTQKSYRILYKSSENLKAGNGTIHRNYNRWIRYLERDIDKKLITAAHSSR